MNAQRPDRTPEVQLYPSKKKLPAEGVELHRLACSGDKDAAIKAFHLFEKLHAENPEDLLLAAYYADCMSLMGRYAADPAAMFANGIKAGKILDNAVNADPDNIGIRLLRGLQSYRLPETFFRRTATAIIDFEHLSRKYEQNRDILPQELYWKVRYLLGRSYERLNMEKEAAEVWKKLLEQSSDPQFKSLLFDKLSDTPVEAVLPADRTGKQGLNPVHEGIHLHDMAVSGDKKAAQKAYEIFKKVYEANPNDPLIEGYYGSSLALKGRFSEDSTTMFSNAVEGMKHLKNAVSRDHNNVKLRLLRAYLLYNLPEAFFHQTEKAAKDFKFLLNTYEKDNGIFSKECYWQLIYDLGICHERLGNTANAQKVWKRLLEMNPDPKYEVLLRDKVAAGE